MPNALVLIGFAEAMAGPEVAWSLLDEGFRVIAFARRGRASGLRHSREVKCYEITAPELDLAASLSDLHTLLTALDANAGDLQRVLFPIDDTAVWLCNELIPQHSHWGLAGPRSACAELALNKRLQTEKAREAGFNVPKTWLVRTAEDAFRLSRTEPFPMILKPVECVPTGGGRVQKSRIWICANASELEKAVAEWGERIPLIAQQFITGTGEGVFGFALPQGIQAWSAHRRLRMMNPQGSGSSACISQPVSPDIRTQAEELIARTQWQGLFMIELLRDDSGKLWFVELNGRPWGSMALSRRQGFEYPAWQAKLALGQEPIADAPPAGTPGIVCRHLGRELMHVLFVLRGPKSRALSNWPSFWTTVGGILNVRQRDTLYNWRRQDPKVFLADCYYTIQDNLFKCRN